MEIITRTNNNTKAYKPLILYIDDEQINLTSFKLQFKDYYSILLAKSAVEGKQLLNENDVRVIIADQRMPNMTGTQFFESISAEYPHTPRLILTGYSDIEAIIDGINKGKIYHYLQKPWNEEEIRIVINNALDAEELWRKNTELLIQLQETNIELHKANNQLLKLDEAKTKFLQIISHEIRTPLNGICGLTDILHDELAESQYSDFIDAFKKSASRLEVFSAKALRYTELNTGAFKLQIEQQNVKQLINDAFSSLIEKADEKNIRLKIECHETEIKLPCDPYLIKSTLHDLLDNSIRFSNTGSEVTVNIFSDNENRKILITDRGKGFPDRILADGFGLFESDEGSYDDNIGIDLATAKLAMELHSGSLVIGNNEKGKGAFVKLIFPK